MKRLLMILLIAIMLIIGNGCSSNSVPKNNTNTDTTTKSKIQSKQNKPVNISVVDSITNKTIGVIDINLVEVSTTNEASSPQEAINVSPPVNFILQREGNYKITIGAKGYNSMVKTMFLKPNSAVTIKLTPLKQLNNENEAYDQLKKATNLPVLRPSYIPAGYKVAPYMTNSGDNKTANPDTEELKLKYVNGNNSIIYSIGEKGDLGESIAEKVVIRGNQGFLDFKIVNNTSYGILIWKEKQNGQEVTYCLNCQGVSKNEIIKIAQSMK